MSSSGELFLLLLLQLLFFSQMRPETLKSTHNPLLLFPLLAAAAAAAAALVDGVGLDFPPDSMSLSYNFSLVPDPLPPPSGGLSNSFDLFSIIMAAA
jgi:hypothetical protein